MWWRAKKLWTLIRWGVRIAGVAFLALIALCFTSYPWKAYLWLGTDPAGERVTPEVLVVLGGGGIPSESGLVRTFHAAELARTFPDTTVIVAVPEDEGVTDGAAERTREELVLRGVAPERIRMETKGRNTREQALNVAKLMDSDPAGTPVLVVTSTYHTRRALLSFRKAGYGKVAASPAESLAVNADLEYKPEEMGGKPLPFSGLGDQMTLRYRFWTHASYEIEIARELVAMGYYRLMGWM